MLARDFLMKLNGLVLFLAVLFSVFVPIIPPAKSAVFIDSYRYRAPAVGVSNTHNAVDTTTTSTYTFSSVSFGADDPTRQIVVALWTFSGTLGAPTSVTIDGNAATLVTSAFPQGNLGVSIYKVSDSSGSSGSVVATYSNAGAAAAISVYRVVNASTTVSATATDTTLTGNDLSNSISIPNFGAAIGAAQAITSGSFAATWTNITENYDTCGDTCGRGFTSSFKTVTASETPTITATFTATPTFGGLALVSFAPL